MIRAASLLLIAVLAAPEAARAASVREPAPAGAVEGAPWQYTRFTAAELSYGFHALAFGSDLRIGARPLGIRKFAHPIRVRIFPGGSVDRAEATRAVVEDYAAAVPGLRLSLAEGDTPGDIELRLIDEKDFRSALIAAFGARIARTFVERTNPQCMTSVQSSQDGRIVRSVTFIIVDKGDEVFRDCAYHELLHAFGLSNHDQGNPWTTLNQKRVVGYLSVYDRALLTLLYDPRMTPGLTPARARALLPRLIGGLGLATQPAAPVRQRR